MRECGCHLNSTFCLHNLPTVLPRRMTDFEFCQASMSASPNVCPHCLQAESPPSAPDSASVMGAAGRRCRCATALSTLPVITTVCNILCTFTFQPPVAASRTCYTGQRGSVSVLAYSTAKTKTPRHQMEKHRTQSHTIREIGLRYLTSLCAGLRFFVPKSLGGNNNLYPTS